MLDGGDHEVADVLGHDSAGAGDVPHNFSVATIERERDAHLLSVVAPDLQRVGAPTGVGLIDRDPAVVAPLLALAAVPLKEQVVHFHKVVDALGIGRCAPGLRRLAAR